MNKVKGSMTQTQKFLQVRDFLLKHRTEYEKAYRDFRCPEFDTFNWSLDFFDIQAENNNRTALWIVEEDNTENKYSFSEIAARSNQVANFFRRHKMKRGDRVLLMFGNQVELWETMLAAIKLGLIMIPSSPHLTAKEINDRIERGGAKFIVISSSDTKNLSEIPDDVVKIGVGNKVDDWLSYEDALNESRDFIPEGVTAASDPMLLYFTSGTTSKPKLVLHSHTSYPVGHLSTMYWIGLQPGDIHFNISAPGWAKQAWSSFFAPWNAGATVFIYNFSRFNAKKVLEVITRCKVNTLCAPPTVWRMLIQENLAAYEVSLREIVSAGEPLNPKVIEKVSEAWKIMIRDGYGQTETSAQIGNSPQQTLKLGSMGKPLPGYKIDLINSDRNFDNEGEVSIDLSENPVGLMLGYESDSGQVIKAVSDGYYHTGDIAVSDDEGYITFIGRNDDVFKSSDYRISPFELESVLIEHEAIAEAAVVPSPDNQRLYVPKAFLLLNDGYYPDDETALSIFKHCRTKLAPYKRIRRIEFSDLPKTASGKIRRVELRLYEANRDLENRRLQEYWENDFSNKI